MRVNVSLALAAADFGLDRAFRPGGVPGVLLGQLVVANLLVGIFNMLPGLPLDGGLVLSADLSGMALIEAAPPTSRCGRCCSQNRTTFFRAMSAKSARRS